MVEDRRVTNFRFERNTDASHGAQHLTVRSDQPKIAIRKVSRGGHTGSPFGATNMQNQRELRLAYIELMLSIKPNMTIMLGSGLGLKPMTMMQQADEFFDRIMRKAYGRKWHLEPAENWPVAIGFIEHADTNLHMHLAIWAPIPVRDQIFVGNKIWKRLRKGGDYHQEPLVNAEKYARYITKEFKLPTSFENVFIYKKNGSEHKE
jgi:hypothetical protein